MIDSAGPGVEKFSIYLRQVRAYLDAFADAFDLKRLVRFRTRVVEALPVLANASEPEHTSDARLNQGLRESSDASMDLGSREGAAPACHRWQLTTQPISPAPDASSAAGLTDEMRSGGSKELFDGVVVCNGHYSEPRLPPSEGGLKRPV